MADAIGATYTDPALNPPTTVASFDLFRPVLYFGNDPMFVIDLPPDSGRIGYPIKFVESGWTHKVWGMSGRKYATVADTVTPDGHDDFPNGFSPTPTDADIPPVEDLTLEYQT